ncbi:hypothetical protein OBBRIDRAFT_805199 [Obba rivulosa]|uniref:Uncharacterized protein n=1 Tax=Obba rivulosa TaxID=1052685 RepID=A0A8E2APX0_9APHY|nr:hypothetical protein OBBRIDRAFT_805199 [Obba rivulosa]
MNITDGSESLEGGSDLPWWVRGSSVVVAIALVSEGAPVRRMVSAMSFHSSGPRFGLWGCSSAENGVCIFCGSGELPVLDQGGYVDSTPNDSLDNVVINRLFSVIYVPLPKAHSVHELVSSPNSETDLELEDGTIFKKVSLVGIEDDSKSPNLSKVREFSLKQGFEVSDIVYLVDPLVPEWQGGRGYLRVVESLPRFGVPKGFVMLDQGLSKVVDLDLVFSINLRDNVTDVYSQEFKWWLPLEEGLAANVDVPTPG